ncbi:hypothetical protein GTY44_04265 [Streptomyces sp. SID5914]|nr:discoidin domain-containing protein [Streptomyces sp. SID5914]MZG12709.1 hypothetical protein [Streptomyces sp. SID5914]
MHTMTWRAWLRSAALLLAAATTAAGLMAPSAANAADAAPPPTVEITESVSDAGFTHPGIGVTADQLRNTQRQVAAGVEPWASHFEAMSQTKYASRTYVAQNQGADDRPKDDAYNKVGMRSRAHDDSLGALTQALMYSLTGEEVYRANALHVLRSWSSLDPAQYKYFPDAHIHTGVPLYYFVTAAEIVRSTEPEHDSLDGYDLRWTERDQQRAEDNLVRPTLKTFLYSQNRQWNQHTYGVLGMIAAAIFLDDKDLYAQRVEWFSVNSTYKSEHTINGGDVNGGLAAQFRKIDADDPLNPYGKDFVELLEMGRDQAHSEGDVTTLSAAARMIHNQGTRLDPVHGTVSTASDAVSPYRFLDNRLLQGANVFAQFMMGGEPPFIDTSGGAGALSQGYRGQFRDLMNDLYYQYTYVEGVDVEKEAPWVARLHEQSDGPLYRYGASVENFWNPRGSGFTDSEYWLAFPEELASQAVQVPGPAASAEVSPVRYGLAVGRGAKLLTDDEGEQIARLDPRRGDAAVAIRRLVWGDRSKSSLAGIRVRTNGRATLQASATASADPFAEIALPDTKNRWTTVWVDVGRATAQGKQVGDYILFLRALGSTARIDVGGVLADATSTITPPVFDDAPSLSFVAVAGERVSRSIAVTDADSERDLSLQGAPRGARIGTDGRLTWSPSAAGKEKFLIVAGDGEATTTLPVAVTVARDRKGAIAASMDGLKDESAYTTESWTPVAKAEAAARAGIQSDSATFAGLLEDLRVAVDDLDLLNPRLADGTLDYSLTATSSKLSQRTLLGLVDGNNQTFWGDLRVTNVDLDFGAGYRVKADRFGILARDNSSNRTEGTNIYGSNDGVSWTLLTEHPTAGDDDAIEFLDVRAEVRDKRYRYLRLQVDEPGIPTDPAYPGIWSVADFRIDGVRSEATLDEVLDAAERTDLSSYSRGSVVLFEREITAVTAAGEKPDADEAALARRALAACDLLEEPSLETSDVRPEWVTASSPSWDGKRDAAANGWAMFDGDPATFTDTTASSGWVSVAPGAGSGLTVAGVRLLPRAGYVGRAEGVQLQASTDGGTTWATLATASGFADGWNRVDLDEPVHADAVRLFAPSGNTNLAEMELITSTLDRSALDLYLAETADLNEADWTPASWAALAEARATAQSVRDDAAADQVAIDDAADGLAAAREGLEVAEG